MVSGIVLVDKPTGPTSHDVVSIARRQLGLKKVGHAGTLDPMASGLLTLGVGQGTKLLTFLTGLDKTYRATIRLGLSTSTDDAEGEPIGQADPASLATLTRERIGATLREFEGTISQVPSSVSAVKIDGKRAYQRVRDGEAVTIPARQVTIHKLQLGDIRATEQWIDVEIEVECSSGTYIRAIARDLGQKLGVGGHLTRLRRTTVGPFDVENACPPEDISATTLLPLSTVAQQLMPHIEVSHSQATELGHGKRIFLDPPEGATEGVPIACIDAHSRLVAIIRVDAGTSRILVGFPDEEGPHRD